MDGRMQEHQMIRWLGRLLVVFTLVGSCEAQAAVETTPLTFVYHQFYFSANVSYDAAGCRVGYMLACQANPNCSAVDFDMWHFSFLSDGTCLYQDKPNYVRANVATIIPVCSFQESVIPFRYNIANKTCERDAPSIFTITFTGGTKVEPSDDSTTSTLPIIATVKQSDGQPPVNHVKVHVSLTVDPKTGGHDHGDSGRPRGGIAEVETCPSDAECWPSASAGKGMTDGNGQVVFNFNAPEASGTHTITATCDGCTNTATKPVDVKVDDLWPISASTYYALTEDGSSKVIGSTTEHSSNHYISSEAQQKLWTLAMDFYNYQLQNGVTKPTLLHLNDASLKWGGKFDIHGKWDGQHVEHRRGTVVDVRANSTSGAIPPELFKKYIEMATKAGIDPHLEYIGDPVRQHFHTRLLNREE